MHLANFSGGAPGRLPQGRSVFERIGRAMRVFQNWWAPRGGGGECSEMFGTCSELVRASPSPLPLLFPGRWFFQKWSELVPKLCGIVGCLSPWVVAPPPAPPPSPPQIFGNVRKCSENVRNMFGTCSENVRSWRSRSPNLTQGGGAIRKGSEKVRKGSELAGACSTWVVAHPANLRKCSEMFGNVRKMFGTGPAAPPTLPPGRPHLSRTFPEQFPNILAGTTT